MVDRGVDDGADILYADLAIQNTGDYQIDAPLLVGVRNLSSPLVAGVKGDRR